MARILLSLFAILLAFQSSNAQEDFIQEVTGTAIVLPKIFEVIFDAEEPGSGDEEPLPGCMLSYQKMRGFYLKGVKAPNLLTYNGSSLHECEKQCCYETAFECKSFTYWHQLKVCFIMNVTEEDDKIFSLAQSSTRTHFMRVPNREVTTKATVIATEGQHGADIATWPLHVYQPGFEAGSGSEMAGSGSQYNYSADPNAQTTTSTFNSPAWTRKSTTTTSTSSTLKSSTLTASSEDEQDFSDKLVAAGPCTKRCVNGGQCEHKYQAGSQDIKQVCKCDERFSGDSCENEIAEAGPGIPAYVIVLAVLGAIILILFLAVFIMYQIYRRKTGEYKVVKQIQKWTRRGKKKRMTTDNPDDFANVEAGTTSPTTSVQSIQGSVTSSTTHSTTTSV